MRLSLPDGFIVLTGGAGVRLGGADKAALVIDGRPLLERALVAIGQRPTVLVGPHRSESPTVTTTREEPAGGGPAAAVAAGVAAMTARWCARRGMEVADPLIALWAVDQIGVGPATWARLTAAARGADGGAVLTADGRRQYGVGVVALSALTGACAARQDWQDQPLRRLLDPVMTVEVEARQAEARDIDTLEDLRWWRARGLGDATPADAIDEGTSDDDSVR